MRLFVFALSLVIGHSLHAQIDISQLTDTLKQSEKRIEYKDSLTSKLYQFMERQVHLHSPQYFLILKQDSLFSWDAWYGSDAYISSGAYSIIADTLFIKGDVDNTNEFEKEYNFIIASAIVVYNDLNYINASIEKKFSSSSIKRCGSLEVALHWINNLKEFKNV